MSIVGITGTFGSGCTYIAKNFLVPMGYEFLSLSKYLRDEYKKANPTDSDPSRESLQNFGNELRRNTSNDYLAKIAIQNIEQEPTKNYVIDSIRNTSEIKSLRKKFGDFYLLGVNADKNIRWDRVSSKYNSDPRIFERDETRDKEEDLEYGQQVTRCFERSDYIIINNDIIVGDNKVAQMMKQKINRFLLLVSGSNELTPQIDETVMALAHAVSHQSSCLKRKVGSIIVDSGGSVFASGFNEVPPKSGTCKEKCGNCYRTYLREDYKRKIIDIIQDEGKTQKVYKEFKENIKMMDYCRALHAEENAILSVIRNGASPSMNSAILYTTTYPCNLCANKIAEIGIKQVVYAAPYPMDEAKETFRDSQVICRAFEGITYLGYFRMEGNFL